MAMKQSLQLRIGQQLAMTPQLQQAIRMLQLSTIELRQEIQQALEQNPMLEVADDDQVNATSEAQQTDGEKIDGIDGVEDVTNSAEAPAGSDGSELSDINLVEENQEIPQELPVDSNWDDVYSSAPSSSTSTATNKDEAYAFDRSKSAETLQDYLLWQLNLSTMTIKDKVIGTTIIESLDQNGYLTESLESLCQTINQMLQPSDTEAVESNDASESHANELELIELAEVNTVLLMIQQFDPPGVAARDLRESLLMQLKLLDSDQNNDLRLQARQLVEQHLELLANRDYQKIKRVMGLKDAELKQVLQIIRSLDPYPGAQIQSSQTEYIIPDVIVRRTKDCWRVELNPEALPKLCLNNHYVALVGQAKKNEDEVFLRGQMQEARWLIKSIHSRNETLLKVASKIVEYQKDFFERGEEAMKPLILHDIAKQVEMHESTISRVTTQKYIYTPHGIFELKYFFSSHVHTTTGEEFSSTAIRALIKKLIANEDSRKPLSDNKIAQMLAVKNIKVARRTVAKYREAMLIPPSNERKQL